MEDIFEWAIEGIYGPNEEKQRAILWEELKVLHRW
jgi:hypothetical protein